MFGGFEFGVGLFGLEIEIRGFFIVFLDCLGNICFLVILCFWVWFGDFFGVGVGVGGFF